MNSLETAKFLFNFEEAKIDQYQSSKIANCNSWLILRRPLYYYIINDKFGKVKKNIAGFDQVNSKGKFFRLWKRVSDFLKFSFKLLGKTFLLKREKLVLFISLSMGKALKREDGKVVDVRVDPYILNGVVKNYVYCELSNKGNPAQNPVIKNDFLLDGLYLPIAILKKLYIKTHKFETQSALLKTEINAFSVVQGKTLELTKNEIAVIFANYFAEYQVYKFFYRLIKPKLIICSDQLFSGKQNAALALGIKTIELQHGFLGAYKPDYYLSVKLKAISDQIPLCTRLAMFGDFHRNTIAKTGFWPERKLVNIGNYSISELRKKYCRQENTKLKVLFPTQWPLFVETQAFLTEFEPFLRQGNIQLILKTHPKEPEQSLRWFSDYVAANKEFANLVSVESDLYTLLLQTDLTIGYHSTALLESVAMGIPTITLSAESALKGIHSYLDSEALMPAIKLAKTKDEAISLINAFLTDEVFKSAWLNESKLVGEYLYAPGYDENIELLVHKVLTEQDL